MRRQQDMQMIIGQITLHRHELDSLKHSVSLRIGHDLLFDAVSAGAARHVLTSRNAGTPSASQWTSESASLFSSEKKSAPAVTISPISRTQA